MSGELRAWVLANGWGEALGLGLGALAGIPAQLWLADRLPAVPAALLAAVAFAAIEGVIVGFAQWSVLVRMAPAVGRWHWVGAIMAGGLTAWLCVSLPFALMPEPAPGAGVAEPPLVLQLLLMSLAGLAAGPLLGVWQALALKRVNPRPWRWILANSLAWAAGLPIVQLAAGGLPAGTPVPVMVVVAALVLFAAGCVVGRIHGPFLLRLTAGLTAGLAEPAPATR